VGAVALWRLAKRYGVKLVTGILLFAGASHLAFQAWQASENYSADRRNPYVYAQTSPDILELVAKVSALAQSSPQRLHLNIGVAAPGNDYWPLPWYLRAMEQVGWYGELPDESLAPVMIVSTQLTAKLDEKKSHQPAGMFELRPGVFLALYVEPELWRAYLNSQSQSH
jgi:predicted membrane-bound mannosyltransferase